MKLISCALSLWIHFFIFAHAFAQSKVPRVYVARYTAESPFIDGVEDEAWGNQPWTEPFGDIEGVRTPRYSTQVKMMWDSTYFYVLARLEEPHVWADITERDEVIFHNNDFEIFIDPDGDTHNYMEFEMNALNTVWDLFLTKPYRNHPRVIDGWDILGLKTAVQVDGTLNDPSDIDQGWVVEIAMPWSGIAEAANERIPVGKFWRINFSRVNWDHEILQGQYHRKKDQSGNYLPEYNWVWSPQWVVNMHEPEHWGFVYFATSERSFTIPENEILRYRLYGIYRQVRRQEVDRNKLSIEHDGKQLPVTYQEHHSGWNIWVKSPVDESIILIKEDGESSIQTNFFHE